MTMVKTAALLLLLLLLITTTTAAAADGEMSRNAGRLLDSARRMAKATRFKERQEELLGKKLLGIGPEDLERVIDALRAEPKPGKSHDRVLGYLEKRYLTDRYGERAAAKIDGLYALRTTEDPKEMQGLLTAALMLPDFRLANEVVLLGARSTHRDVRLRAAIAVSDLIAFGGADPAAEKTFTEFFGDADAAVRAVAIRRGFEVRFDPVFDLALARLSDAAKATAVVRGEGEDLRPGAEALRGLTELTRIEREMTYKEYRAADSTATKALDRRFRAWWEKWGSFFPPPGFREAIFSKKPSSTKSFLIPRNETTATFMFWSAKDRTRVRVHIDEIQLAATSLYDWRVNFHVRYMASGMRPDDGEAYRRNHFMGTPFVLARKKIGCFVLVFQHLIDGQLKVRLDFHDLER